MISRNASENSGTTSDSGSYQRSESRESTVGNTRRLEPSESSGNTRNAGHTQFSLEVGSIVHVMHEPRPLGLRALIEEAYMPLAVPRMCRCLGTERELAYLKNRIATTIAAEMRSAAVGFQNKTDGIVMTYTDEKQQLMTQVMDGLEEVRSRRGQSPMPTRFFIIFQTRSTCHLLSLCRHQQ